MKVVVFISGAGTNLQALIDASIKIALVVSNQRSCHGLIRATVNSIPTLIVEAKKEKSTIKEDIEKGRELYDGELSKLVVEKVGVPDLIVFAGFMRIVSSVFLNAFKTSRIINLHPSLPAGPKGLNVAKLSYDQFQQKCLAQNPSKTISSQNELGVMVHEVIESVDEGRCLMSKVVICLSNESFASFESRMDEAEHALIVKVVKGIIDKEL